MVTGRLLHALSWAALALLSVAAAAEVSQYPSRPVLRSATVRVPSGTAPLFMVSDALSSGARAASLRISPGTGVSLGTCNDALSSCVPFFSAQASGGMPTNVDLNAYSGVLTLSSGTGLVRMFSDGSGATLDSVPVLTGTDGTFTATLTGVSGTVTATSYYWLRGHRACVQIPELTGSNNNSGPLTVTGLPASVKPLVQVTLPIIAMNDSGWVSAAANITAGSQTIGLSIVSFGTFGWDGIAGFSACWRT